MQLEQLAHDELERLRPLWLTLHRHHQAVAPELAPYVDDRTSWSERQKQYLNLFASGGIVVVARKGDEDVGYGAWAPTRMPWPAAFDAPERVVELLTLVVKPDQRSTGVGSKLLEAGEQLLGSGHPVWRLVGVVPNNHRAVSFYRGHGFRPTWLTLVRFGRSAPAFESPSTADVGTVAPADVDTLKPLWLTLHHHHRRVAPELAPFVSDEESWRAFRGIFVEAAHRGLLFAAGPRSAPLGMLCADMLSDPSTFLDTWETRGEIAEIEVLVVNEGARGRGIGTQLLGALDRTLRARGVTNQIVGAIAPNRAAIEFYEQHHFGPAWLELTRF